MNQICRQVNKARFRLFCSELLKRLCICLFAGLTIAMVALAVPKIWHLPFLADRQSMQVWIWSWLSGAVVGGVLVALAWAWLRRKSMLDAAIEVDRRFRLKERLSSVLALSDEQRASDAGLALVEDAERKAESIEVGEQFSYRPTRQILLPVFPALILAVLGLVPDAQASRTPAAPVATNSEIKSAMEETRKKIGKKIEELEAKGLKDAADNLKSLEKKIDNLSSGLKDGDRKKALVELNSIKQEVAERQKEIGGSSSELKQQLNQLKKVTDGPAKKLSQAINDGDFKEAQEAIRDLLKDLKEGRLSDEDKRKLAGDLNKIADELKKLADQHEREKQELRDKIQQATKDGDLEKAARLQQQLEKKEQQDQQMEKLQKMADNLQKCSNCMKQGNGQPKKGQQNSSQAGQESNQSSDADLQDAIKSLEEMADSMQQLEGELDELEDLEDIMEQIDGAKNNCQGCQGQGQQDQIQWQDWANGSGTGAGKREKQETETGTYKSRVKGNLQKGETIVTGNADGNNISGKSISEVREIVRTSMESKKDPLENQKLPKSQREHARQYFEKLRGD